MISDEVLGEELEDDMVDDRLAQGSPKEVLVLGDAAT